MVRNIFSGLLALSVALIAGCGPNVSVAERPSSASASGQARAKNVILFIGDGMGVSTVTAGRIYAGQSQGRSGEENLLSFERFPQTALVKTYNSNQQVPDSAGTASAINTGVKTRAGMMGVGPDAFRADCASARRNNVSTIAEVLIGNGRAVGLVSTARLTHATPGAVFAHVPEREWEDDSRIPLDQLAKGCRDIAHQLVDFPFTVAMGGGRKHFLGSSKGGARRSTNADLVADWYEKSRGHYVTTRAEMTAAAAGNVPLLGIFADSHMTYMLDRKVDTTEPTLSEMTEAAIERLAHHGEGYFLMVEAGRIDHGHHAGKAVYALSEVQELSNAVQTAMNNVDLSDTLILVTADHSHVFTIAGYPTRGNPILGLAMGNDARGNPTGKPLLASDGKPYTTLGYQNGPGAVTQFPRLAPSHDPYEFQQALVPLSDETHGGEDVPLYAIGAGATMVHGVIEQNRIFNLMLDAFGIVMPQK